MTELMIRSVTREQWLESAVLALRPLFEEIDVTLPDVRVSVGWPSRGGTSNVIGQCWAGKAAEDGVAQVFISPRLGGDIIQVLGVLIHELIHAWDNCESGHKGKFARTAKAIGLQGKMTATEVSIGLAERLNGIAEDLGEFPHGVIRAGAEGSGPKKQTTRMLKLECPEDGYIVRTTAKWLDELGYPSCPCGSEMVDG